MHHQFVSLTHSLQKILPSRMFQPDLQQLLPERYILTSLNEVHELRATTIVNKKRTTTQCQPRLVNFEGYRDFLDSRLSYVSSDSWPCERGILADGIHGHENIFGNGYAR